jgi:lipopolysaccharide/colanic/teichoic acid biosynthesis glycosyltransferase
MTTSLGGINPTSQSTYQAEITMPVIGSMEEGKFAASEPVLAEHYASRSTEQPPAAVTLSGRVSFWRFISRPSFQKSLFLAGDLLALSAAHRVSEILIIQLLGVPGSYLGPSSYYLFYVPFFAFFLYFFGAYKALGLRRPEKELEVLVKGLSLFFVALVCANFVLFKLEGFSRYLVVAWFGLAQIFVLGVRFSLRSIYGRLWRRGLARQTALLIGPRDRFVAFEQGLAVQRYQGYEILGILSEPGRQNFSVPGEKIRNTVLGVFDDWEKIAVHNHVQLVLFSLAADSLTDYPQVLDVIRRCQEKGIEVEVYSDFFSSAEFEYERNEFSGFFRFYATPHWSRVVQIATKAVLDRVIGIGGSAITLLMTPFIGLLLKCEDGGPVFHRREYVACDGSVRYYRKFRTMIRNADLILENDCNLKEQYKEKHKLERDPRVLRSGRILRKYSIDEFPQFFSLLVGDLTFVGPRVVSREEISRYGDSLSKLLSVKPGMTGFWQVMGRQNTSYEERVQMDMFYIDHWSIWMDLVIMLKTFWKVVRADGAH